MSMQETAAGVLGAAPQAGSPVESTEREVAAFRREIAALRRQNDRLRAQLASLRTDPVAKARGVGVRHSRQSRAQSAAPRLMRCAHCGRTLDLQSSQQDHTLVRAACCPWCDGQLVPVDRAARPGPGATGEPSIYLG